MRYDSRFTRSGNGKPSKSGARVRRSMERAEKTGWASRVAKNNAQYERWINSFQNVKVYDERGRYYYAWDRPVLIHKGRKP